MRKFLWLISFLSMILSVGCSRDTLRIRITDEVLSEGYLGNGAEWDPYDEAPSWGCPVSDADWEKLFTRVDFMRPGFVRCMIGSPYRYFNDGAYERERESASLLKLLSYCQSRGIDVIYGEFNPPRWSMKGSQEWIDMSVDYLAWLVLDNGFDCIRHFIIFNEPDGDWASPNGDFDFWKGMMERFDARMAACPGLKDKVSLAGPDVVVDYRNPASEYDAVGWVKATASSGIDSLVGLYDIHAYPGQHQVRSGEFASALGRFREAVPSGRKLILGEAGYKYWREADSLLRAEELRRAAVHPFTKGSDANMLCGDFFYGLDLPLLAIETMNSGLSGAAIWMMDDAMHSCGDSGKPVDVKVWGLWNILGEEVFGDASLEDPKPAFWSWSLMCRFFPKGCDIVKIEGGLPGGVSAAAAVKDGAHTLAVVNLSPSDVTVKVDTPFRGASIYRYAEGSLKVDPDLLPLPSEEGIEASSIRLDVSANSFVLLTDMK